MKDLRDIKIDIGLLEKIAHYYEFPLTVFFAPQEILKGTRRKSIAKKISKYRKKIDKVLKDFQENI